MIVLDTETTGLVEKASTPLDQQPHIIEFAGIKLDDVTLEVQDSLQFLCKPPIAITPLITKITGLDDNKLANELPFAAHLEKLQKFFFGQWIMVAHHAAFDRNMIGLELRRLNKQANFPWPIEHICTIERSFDINGYRLNLAKLHQLATGEEHINGAHRAMVDVEALVKCVKYLRGLGKL